MPDMSAEVRHFLCHAIQETGSIRFKPEKPRGRSFGDASRGSSGRSQFTLTLSSQGPSAQAAKPRPSRKNRPLDWQKPQPNCKNRAQIARTTPRQRKPRPRRQKRRPSHKNPALSHKNRPRTAKTPPRRSGLLWRVGLWPTLRQRERAAFGRG